jgi:hypothetical protein
VNENRNEERREQEKGRILFHFSLIRSCVLSLSSLPPRCSKEQKVSCKFVVTIDIYNLFVETCCETISRKKSLSLFVVREEVQKMSAQ